MEDVGENKFLRSFDDVRPRFQRGTETIDVTLVRSGRNLQCVLNVEGKAGGQLQQTFVVCIVSATRKRCALCGSGLVRPSKEGLCRDSECGFEAGRRSVRLREKEET